MRLESKTPFDRAFLQIFNSYGVATSLAIFPVLINLAFFICTTTAIAQGAPPPPPDGHGGNTNQPANGGGAPIGSGLGILLALGAAYGGKKVWGYYYNQERE